MSTKRINFIMVLGAIFAFMFVSCDFTGILDALSKTGINVFSDSNVHIENVNSAIKLLDDYVGDLKPEDVDGLKNEIDNVVDAFKSGTIRGQEQVLDCARGIFDTLVLEQDEFDDVLKGIVKAGLTDEGKIALFENLSQITPRENLKEVATYALENVAEVFSDTVDVENAGELKGLLNDLKEMSDNGLDNLTQMDVLMVSMLATAVDTVVDVMSSEGGMSVDNTLSNKELLSNVFGIIQVSNIIKSGAQLSGNEVSPVVGLISGLTSMIDGVVSQVDMQNL